MSRITSFSVSPSDTAKIEEINKLKTYSKKTGISFSYLMVQAITKLNKELNL